MVIFYLNICTTIGFLVVLVLPTLMSAKPVKISDRGVFYGVCVLASENHIAFITNPKISNSDFFIQILIS